MEKILGIVINKKKEATMTNNIWIVEDLSSWELIDPSDDDENEDYSYDEVDLHVLECSPPNLSTQSPSYDPMDHPSDRDDRVDLVKHVSIDEQCVYNDYDCDDDAEEEEVECGEYGGGFDLDDELVPKSVSDRFGRQRIRKLGKRAYPKMNKSKRLPYSYNRPGCVHGKHGLGLKHNVIH